MTTPAQAIAATPMRLLPDQMLRIDELMEQLRSYGHTEVAVDLRAALEGIAVVISSKRPDGQAMEGSVYLASPATADEMLGQLARMVSEQAPSALQRRERILAESRERLAAQGRRNPS